MNITNIILLLNSLFLLWSCTSSDILIKKNGSAHVAIVVLEKPKEPIKNSEITEISDSISLRDFHSEIIKLYSSPVIKNLSVDTSSGGVKLEFDITKVDSLGNYLSPLFPYYVDFSLKEKTLTITGSDGKADPEDDIGGYTNMLTVQTVLRFESEIISMKTENSYIKLIDNKKIEINTSLGEMNYCGKQNKVVVKLK